MLIYLAALGAGFWALAWSAAQLAEGASELARRLHVSAFTIGVVIIGFGTSAPELLVSSVAAVEGRGNIAIGNAVGSNLANLALILGIAALLLRLHGQRALVARELPLLLLATATAFVMLRDDFLGRLEGAALLAVLALIIFDIIRRGPQSGTPAPDAPARGAGAGAAAARTLGGLALLLLSAWVLVWAAAGLARALGVGELVVGLVLVAVGTSLPELAAAVAAIRRTAGSAGGLILGSVVGSNLFNTLGVVGLPAVLRPFSTDPDLLPSAALMLAMTALVAALLLAARPRFSLGRGAGAALVVCYGGYIVWLAAAL